VKFTQNKTKLKSKFVLLFCLVTFNKYVHLKCRNLFMWQGHFKAILQRSFERTFSEKTYNCVLHHFLWVVDNYLSYCDNLTFSTIPLSQVWIPLKALMFVRVFLCCIVLCRYRPCDRLISRTGCRGVCSDRIIISLVIQNTNWQQIVIRKRWWRWLESRVNYSTDETALPARNFTAAVYRVE
jgi:hypothetical protein